MSGLLPTPDEERRIALRNRADVWKSEGVIDPGQRVAIEAALASRWTSFGMLASIALFVLTFLAVGTAGWFVDLILPFDANLLTAAASIGIAELFVVRFRWWGTGVEQALWLSGLCWVILSLPGNGSEEAVLLFAAAAAIAGFRLRSAPLGVLGALLVVLYLGLRSNSAQWRVSPHAEAFAAAAIAVAVATAIGATFAVSREMKRPSTERLWSGLLILVPVAALLASGYWEQRYVLAGIGGALAMLLVAAGLVLRHHAPLLSAMLLSALAGADLVRSAPIVEEAMLGIFGAVFLTLAFAVSRLLRGRTRGLVIAQSKLTVIDEAVETAASFGAADHHAEAPAPQGPEGGGGFGGAGSTGEY